MRDVKDTASLIPTLNPAGIRQLTEDGIIEGGMIPKVQSALVAIDHGVSKVHLIDGRIPHALLWRFLPLTGLAPKSSPETRIGASEDGTIHACDSCL